MSYTDYDYYRNEYGGSLIPETDFLFVSGKASDRIDEATFGRLENGVPDEYADKVKRCCCELAESIYSYSDLSGNMAIAGSGTISSEKIGEYSITYNSGSEQIPTISAQLHGGTSGLEDIYYSIIRRHLGRTGLLFRGVD